MLYEPLRFIEQIKGYTLSPNEKLITTQEINEHAIAFTEKLFQDEELTRHFLHDFCKLHKYLDNGKDLPLNKEYNIWREIKDRFTKEGYQWHERYKIAYNESDIDFFNQLMMSYIYYDWRWHKYTYRVAPYLGKQLCQMDFPENAMVECFSKLPAKIIYIDLSQFQTGIVEDLSGMFVTVDKYKDIMMVQVISIINGDKGRLLPVFVQSRIELGRSYSEQDKIKLVGTDDGEDPNISILCEDGVRRKYNTDLSLKFLTNFLVYLQASNKDIEELETSKETFRKPIDKSKEPKNKFKELRCYDVGFRISTPAVNKKNKDNGEESGQGSPKSPHYRKAHWHHFWTGSGEEKELIIKWVEGVFVNGKAEAKVAVVHDAK